ARAGAPGAGGDRAGGGGGGRPVKPGGLLPPAGGFRPGRCAKLPRHGPDRRSRRAVAVAPAGRIRPSGGHRQARDAHDRLAPERAGTPRERGDRMTGAGPATASEPRLGLLQLVPLRGDSAGARFETTVPGQPVTIGRKATNDLVLRDATVSRDHALIEPTPAGWRITARKSNALLMRSGE